MRWPGVAAIAVIAAVLWYAGSLDKPLAEVGLNRETCAQDFGATMCGDELVSFCKENYDRATADTCDGVLKDAGIEPSSIQEDQQEAQEKYEDCIAGATVEDRSLLETCEAP